MKVNIMANKIPIPVYRRLRGYSFDPSLSVQLDTALINEATFKICWEEDLELGPIGEYVEVVDFDPASNCFYEPVDLNARHILAQDGLVPSESNPQFHQQMVYAVTMTTIQNFEKALGRNILWSSYRDGKEAGFLQRLRIYPHALRQANAYYSPVKKALLFGYFPASSNAPEDHIPNGIVFTCLSHDIVAHETTHALLDGMHRRFIEDSHPDTLAFHEAFADIIALFQHFTFPEVLRQQIAKTRGDLASQSLLGQLAQQFGHAIGQYGALRDAIGEFDKKENKWKPHQPNPNDYQTETEPHARGAILVAAVFEAFLSIYKSRIADLLRIASNGTGVLTPGELHPDLVNRLADEAAKTAKQILSMCIRALDYCPPVDINFGDYLRAIITSDTDLVPDDDLGYRIAFIEAFRRRGIYPRDIRTLSEESLCWSQGQDDDKSGIFKFLAEELRLYIHKLSYLDEYPKDLPYLVEQVSEADWNQMKEREKIFNLTKVARVTLHEWIKNYPDEKNNTIEDFESLTGVHFIKTSDNEHKLKGLKFDSDPNNENLKRYVFEVHSFRGARRVGPDGNTRDEVIISLTQKRKVSLDENSENSKTFDFRGGCTLILDLQSLKLKYVIKKLIDDSDGRLSAQRDYRKGEIGSSLRATYFGDDENQKVAEPFALLHSDL
jgi:hypothetical protein